MNTCCTMPTSQHERCRSCGQIGPIVGAAPVRAHRPGAIDGPWQHCQNQTCPVVYYLGGRTVDENAVITRVGAKATGKPTPVCFCFAHTADDVIVDAAANDGASTIKDAIKTAVATAQCACEHLNPSGRCCLAEVHRVLKSVAAVV